MAFLLAACQTTPTPPSDAGTLAGTIEVDGSSTVFPISEAVAEEFHKKHPGVQVNVGVSGTGGGFKRFVVGETQVSDASRPIAASEAAQAKANGVEYVELPVAIDGLAVLVNSQNTWVTCLTTVELKRIWEPGSTINNWSQVREGFPNRPLHLYGPGTDSGTFDYFTEVIAGEAKASRPDFNASEDDNVLVQGVIGDPNALGYFGYAYFTENMGSLKLLAVDGGKGCVAPSDQTVKDGTYAPLARPLFIYVNVASLARPEMKAFVDFYLQSAPALVAEVGYVPLPAQEYEAQRAKIG
ncbi:MAG: PstS family phosphate ABC transporter substrate-binding protein [Chloroflexi bacterium]|nr:PstS family phosphate ABC transporter substrate-binding protein [Chloroflexota bacterium]